MMNYKITFGFILFLFVGFNANAQYQDQFKLVERIDGKYPIEVYEIFNGVKLYVKMDTTAPKVHARVVMKMGYSNEDNDKKGLSELLRILLDNGTANVGTYNFSQEKPIIDHEKQLYMGRNRIRGTRVEDKFTEKYYEIIKRASFYAIPSEIPRIMDELNIEQKSYVNQEEIVFDYKMANTEMKRWFQIQNERITNPAFRQYSIAAQNAKLALFQNNTAEIKKQNLLNSWLQPYGVAIPIPDNVNTNLDSVSSDDVWEFYQKHLYSDNVSIFINGNIKGEDMAMLAFSYFGHLSKNQEEKSRMMDIPLNDMESENEGPENEININYKVKYQFQGDYTELIFLKNWLNIELSNICFTKATVKVNITDFEYVDLLNINFSSYEKTDWMGNVNLFLDSLTKGKITFNAQNIELAKKQTLEQLKNKSYTSNGSFELFDISFRNKMFAEELFYPEKTINAITDSTLQIIAIQIFSNTKFVLKTIATKLPKAEMPMTEAYSIHLNLDKVSTFGNNILNAITNKYKPNDLADISIVSSKNKIPFYHIKSNNDYAVLSFYFSQNFEGNMDLLKTYYENYIGHIAKVEIENNSNFTIVKLIGNNQEIKKLSKMGSMLLLNILTTNNHQMKMMLMENNETHAEFETWTNKLGMLEILEETKFEKPNTNNWVGMENNSKMKTKDLPLFLLLNTYYYNGEYALIYNEMNQVHGLSNQYKNYTQLPMNKSEKLQNTFFVRTQYADSVKIILKEISQKPIDELRLKKAKLIIKKQVLENGLSTDPLLNKLYSDYFKTKDSQKLAEKIEKLDAKTLKKYADKYFKSIEIIK